MKDYKEISTRHVVYYWDEEVDWEDHYTIWCEFHEPDNYQGNRIRNWIVDKTLSLIGWTEGKWGKCVKYDDALESLKVISPVRSWIYKKLQNLALTLCDAFYDGSIQHYDFQIENPPCLFPSYHGIPDFGSFPIITVPQP